jgi:hypothetical protein
MRNQITAHRSGKTSSDNLGEFHQETRENGNIARCGHAAQPLRQMQFKRAISGKLSSKK